MNTTVEKISSNQVKINFVAESELLEKGIQSAYRKLVKRFNIPGFRKGKAPRRVIEMQYGKEIFYEDAFEDIFPELYREAIDKNDLHPVDQPSLCEGMKIETGEPLEFSVEVYVKPDVALGMYKGVSAHKHEIDVTDDDVNAEIERERERVSRMVDAGDRPVRQDDQVNIDYEGYADGEQFEGGTAQGHDLTIGSDAFIPGFEEQLIGANVGDEVTVEVVFPEEYHAENLKGKNATFNVKINSIRVKEMPELDDEFAKDVSEFSTLKEYKENLKAKLVSNAQERANAEFENEVIDAIVNNASIDVPHAMVESQIDSIMRDMEIRMMYQGMRMQDFMKYTGQTEEQMRAMYEDEALRRVKTNLVIEEISKLENIQAEEDEIEEEIGEYAKQQNASSADEFKEKLTDSDREYFKERVVVKNTVKLLTDAAIPEACDHDHGDHDHGDHAPHEHVPEKTKGGKKKKAEPSAD